MRFRKAFATGALAFVLGLLFVSCSAESEIAMMGAKDFKVDDMDQYDLEQKLVYAADSQLASTEPSLPRAANEAIYLHASAGLENGIVRAHLIIVKDVYSENIVSPYEELPDGVEMIETPGKKTHVELGERVEFEGYTFRFVAAQIESSGDSYSAFVLETIPDNVTIFPSGNPNIW